jgi:hypothetical protein
MDTATRQPAADRKPVSPYQMPSRRLVEEVSRGAASWRDALLRPSPATFARLTAPDSRGELRGNVWTFFGALTGYAVAMSLAMLTIAVRYWSDKGWPLRSPAEIPADLLLVAIALVAVLMGAGVFALLVVAARSINVAAAATLVRVFGGRLACGRAVYAFAADSCPLLVLAGLAAGASAPQWFRDLPLRPVAAAVFALGVYPLALNVLAVKGGSGIGWLGAVVSGGVLQVVVLAGLGLATLILFLMHWFLLATMLFGA